MGVRSADTGHPIARIDGFDMGYVSRLKSERLPPNAMTRALNCTIENSDAVKRFGTSKYNAVALSTGAAPQSLYWSQGMFTDKLVVTHGATISNLTGGVETVLTGGLLVGARYGFAEALKGGTNFIYMATNGQAMRKWDGVAAATIAVPGAPTSLRYLAWHKRRLWAFGPTLYGMFLSNRDDGETWDLSNFLPFVQPADGIPTGLVSLEDYLVAFTEGGVFLIFGNNPDPPGVNLVTRKVGTRYHGAIAPYSIVLDDKGSAGGTIYYVAKDGIYALEGQTPKYLSRLIEPDWKSVNKAAIDKCASVIDDDRLWVAVPFGTGQTTPNRVYVFHLRKPWLPVTIFTGWNVNLFVKYFLTGQILFGDALRAFVVKYDTTVFDDEGADVDNDIITAALAFQEAFGDYAALRARIMCDVSAGGTITVSLGPNDADPDTDVDWREIPAGAITLEATGPRWGDYGGDVVVDRNGVVDYPANVVRDGDPRRANYWRMRFRAVNKKAMVLRRALLYAQDDSPSLTEG